MYIVHVPCRYRLESTCAVYRILTCAVSVINPRCACAARITVVGSVCPCVCLLSHISPLELSVRPENAVTHSAGKQDENFCGVFSETAEIQHFPHCNAILRRPFFAMRKNTHALVYVSLTGPLFLAGCMDL